LCEKYIISKIKNLVANKFVIWKIINKISPRRQTFYKKFQFYILNNSAIHKKMQVQISDSILCSPVSREQLHQKYSANYYNIPERDTSNGYYLKKLNTKQKSIIHKINT